MREKLVIVNCVLCGHKMRNYAAKTNFFFNALNKKFLLFLGGHACSYYKYWVLRRKQKVLNLMVSVNWLYLRKHNQVFKKKTKHFFFLNLIKTQWVQPRSSSCMEWVKHLQLLCLHSLLLNKEGQKCHNPINKYIF